MSRRIALGAATILAVVAGVSAPQQAHASKAMLVGIFDEAHTLYGDPNYSFPLLKSLNVGVLRVTLYWGGAKFGVAKSKPFDPIDPADPAYNWSLYDRLVRYAAANGIQVLFSVYGTPNWANRGRGLNHAPTSSEDLAKFAYAAAIRYSGTYPGDDGEILPPVRFWLAWNEPNNPVFLSPQYKRSGKKWIVQSAKDYVNICSAVYQGVHTTLLADEKVACGGTAPRGNNSPTSSRPSVSPLGFMSALHTYHLKKFDAYAHHPYYGKPSESPTTRPPGPPGHAVTLGNINTLIAQLTKYWGRKPLWITEYGYQTRPPDPVFGVSWARQAAWLTQSFSIARRNPRITMMLWYLLQDEPRLSGWQSGLLTANGQKKPSFAAFQRMAS
ncbi:MAG: hypothetical protein C5B48_07010 [Candidatus Rokuibacteriota bacterium]|nr:MAG: hypothetical protein C5B48_07010 [Candidatus Rokubacteria bacterium]